MPARLDTPAIVKGEDEYYPTKLGSFHDITEQGEGLPPMGHAFTWNTS